MAAIRVRSSVESCGFFCQWLFATVGNWFLSAVFTLEMFRLYCENGYNITVKHLKKELSGETSRGLKCENKTYRLKRCIVNITDDLLCIVIYYVFPWDTLFQLNLSLTHLPVRQHLASCLPSFLTCCLLLPVLYTSGPFRLSQHICVLRHQLSFQSPSTAHHFRFHITQFTLWFLLRCCLVHSTSRLFHQLLIRIWRPLLTGHLNYAKRNVTSC